jgi:hypothetical protein
MEFMNLKFEILKILKDFFLLDSFILSVMVLQCVMVKNYRFSFQFHWKEKSIMMNFWGCLDCEIRCTILCKVYLELNIYPLVICFFGFERLKCRFQFFIPLLPSFLNKFEHNATILDSLKKNCHYDFHKSPL